MAPEEQKQNEQDSHLDTPSESNREKHINFREKEESEEQSRSHHSENERNEHWQKGIEEGRRENQNSGKSNSSIALDNDETIGIP